MKKHFNQQENLSKIIKIIVNSIKTLNAISITFIQNK